MAAGSLIGAPWNTGSSVTITYAPPREVQAGNGLAGVAIVQGVAVTSVVEV
jgi:hypothetical protein